MLKKFIAVKNVGRFINSAHTGVQECLKTTLVLGGNGFGKTTLASILRSNGTNDPAIIAGRARLGTTSAPDVEMLLEAGKATFATGRGAYPSRSFLFSTACSSPRMFSPAMLWTLSNGATCTA
jgi:hypothetical protein